MEINSGDLRGGVKENLCTDRGQNNRQSSAVCVSMFSGGGITGSIVQWVSVCLLGVE